MSETQTALAIIAFIVAGLLFLLLEILTPMFGVLVVLSVAAFGAAVWLCFTVSQMLGIGVLLALVFVIPAYLVLLVKLVPKSPLGKRLFLGRAPERPGTAAPEATVHSSMVGKEGVAETPLRPAGAVRIDGRRTIATAESGMIEKGATVRVVRAAGTNVVVRKVDR